LQVVFNRELLGFVECACCFYLRTAWCHELC
jgi:hypothetical protein